MHANPNAIALRIESSRIRPLNSFSTEQDPQIRAKLEELHAWTICYNRGLVRITAELSELRARDC